MPVKRRYIWLGYRDNDTAISHQVVWTIVVYFANDVNGVTCGIVRNLYTGYLLGWL